MIREIIRRVIKLLNRMRSNELGYKAMEEDIKPSYSVSNYLAMLAMEEDEASK